jgi:hypothetical protein
VVVVSGWVGECVCVWVGGWVCGRVGGRVGGWVGAAADGACWMGGALARHCSGSAACHHGPAAAAIAATSTWQGRRAPAAAHLQAAAHHLLRVVSALLHERQALLGRVERRHHDLWAPLGGWQVDVCDVPVLACRGWWWVQVWVGGVARLQAGPRAGEPAEGVRRRLQRQGCTAGRPARRGAAAAGVLTALGADAAPQALAHLRQRGGRSPGGVSAGRAGAADGSELSSWHAGCLQQPQGQPQHPQRAARSEQPPAAAPSSSPSSSSAPAPPP